jgi:hypothetical protein
MPPRAPSASGWTAKVGAGPNFCPRYDKTKGPRVTSPSGFTILCSNNWTRSRPGHPIDCKHVAASLGAIREGLARFASPGTLPARSPGPAATQSRVRAPHRFDSSRGTRTRRRAANPFDPRATGGPHSISQPQAPRRPGAAVSATPREPDLGILDPTPKVRLWAQGIEGAGSTGTAATTASRPWGHRQRDSRDGPISGPVRPSEPVTPSAVGGRRPDHRKFPRTRDPWSSQLSRTRMVDHTADSLRRPREARAARSRPGLDRA